MDNIIFSANVVFPLLIIMFAGFITRRLNIIDDNTSSQCNSLAFKVFLPILLFNNARDCSLETLANPKIFIYVTVAILSLFIIATFFVLVIEKDNKKRGVMIQGICRSNYALFGIPLIILLMPNADMGLPSLLIAIVIPLFNLLSVTVLTYFSSEQKANFKDIFLAILKNPLIIATFIGLIFMFLQINIIEMLDNPLRQLGDIASPFALFMLGARFKFNEIKRVGKQLFIVCVSRLVLIPVIIIGIAIILGFRSVELACILVIFASPTAVSSYTMAEKMGGDGDLASSIVIFTSTFSIISIFSFIYFLRIFALI